MQFKAHPETLEVRGSFKPGRRSSFRFMFVVIVSHCFSLQPYSPGQEVKCHTLSPSGAQLAVSTLVSRLDELATEAILKAPQAGVTSDQSNDAFSLLIV